MDGSTPIPGPLWERLGAVIRFLHAAFSHCSRGLFLGAMLLGVVRGEGVVVTSWIQYGHVNIDVRILRPPLGEIQASCLLVAVLIAEQWVRAGARRLVAYGVAVFIGSVGTAIIYGFIGSSLCTFINHCAAQMSWGKQVVAMGKYAFGDAISRGAFAAFIYSYREQMLGSIRALRGAEIERVQTEQRLNETRLRALQAQVDPQHLLDTLAHVEALYPVRPAEADGVLDTLIQDLRAVSVRTTAA